MTRIKPRHVSTWTAVPLLTKISDSDEPHARAQAGDANQLQGDKFLYESELPQKQAWLSRMREGPCCSSQILAQAYGERSQGQTFFIRLTRIGAVYHRQRQTPSSSVRLSLGSSMDQSLLPHFFSTVLCLQCPQLRMWLLHMRIPELRLQYVQLVPGWPMVRGSVCGWAWGWG